MEFYHYPL